MMNHNYPRTKMSSAASVSGISEMTPSSMQSMRSQSSMRSQPLQRRQLALPVRCNRCRKPLSATVFVLSCKCLFCEECTFSHFANNSNCPSCNRTMRESDFKEITIMPRQNDMKMRESVLKQIFIKSSPEAPCMDAKDLWDGIERQHHNHRMTLEFVLRQFLKENMTQTRRSAQVQHGLKALKEDQERLKKESNKQKEIIEAYKRELAIAGQKLEEKDHQIAQLRKMVESRAPPSPGDLFNSNGVGTDRSHGGDFGEIIIPGPSRPRRVSDQHRPPPLSGNNSRFSSGHHGRGGHPVSQQQTSPHNPRALNPYPSADRTNPYQHPLSSGGHPREGSNRSSPINPYYKAPVSSRPPPPPPPQQQQFPKNPYGHPLTQTKTSYNRSHGSGTVASRRSTGSGSAGGRIRHITANTGYSFGGDATEPPSSSHSYHSGGSGGGRKRQRAMSPSHAYTANPYTHRHRGPSQGYRR